MRTPGAQNVNWRSQNETDGFRTEVSHALRTGRRWVSVLHCDWRWNKGFSPHSWIQGKVTAITPHAFLQNQYFKTSISVKKKLRRPFSGTEKAFSWSTSCLLAQQLRPLHIATPWQGFDEPFKTKGGECCHVASACSRQRAAPFRVRHHCASGKIQVGYSGSSVVQSGPRAQRFPLVSLAKETSRWENVRRRWWSTRRSHDVIQRAGGKLPWHGDIEAGSKT